MVAQPDRSIICFIFGMKDVERVCRILWAEYFDRPIEQFTYSLDFGIVSMYTILTLPFYILSERLPRYKLREMRFVSLLQREETEGQSDLPTGNISLTSPKRKLTM